MKLREWVPLIVISWNATSLLAADVVDFNRDIRPILSNHCWSCHGPDEASRESGLRLDRRDSATSILESGKRAIAAGDPDSSELLLRIRTTEQAAVMPPPSAKRPLTDRQKQLIETWIAQGARYADHWAFTAPVRPAMPSVKSVTWPLNGIDAFVLHRLEQAGIPPSPPAERAGWLRRVTLDLTGLPPSSEDVEAFVLDDAPDSHERVVDRLFASPRHAERMAQDWLDVSRFADTNGYNNDETRTMWPWRDWVLSAFARGMPYDQFVTEQLAGDLLPNATIQQRVATGFCRNHVLTTEGGIIEEEYHVEYVADRIHTTSTVFLGLSMQCARCHEHKYDPFTQRDYYQFAAFFNNVPDKVVSYSKGRMAEPLLQVPSAEQQMALDQLARRRAELEKQLAAIEATSEAAVTRWEAGLSAEEKSQMSSAGLVAAFSFEEPSSEPLRDARDPAREAKIHGTVGREAGKIGQALRFDGKSHVEVGEVGDFDAGEAFSLAAWIRPASNEPITALSKIDEANAYRGYDMIIEAGKVACHVVHHWPDRAFKIVTNDPLPLNEWHHVVVTYDGSRRSSGAKIYVNGELRATTATTDNTVDDTLKTDKPFHIGKRFASAPFQGRIDEVQIFSRALSSADVKRLAEGRSSALILEILSLAAERRTDAQRQTLRQFYLDSVDAAYRDTKKALADVPSRIAEIEKDIPQTMVMEEKEPARKAFLLRRGQYDQRGDEVSRGVPASLSPWPEGAPANRLGFARWLMSSNHPLTARVAVNRWWELFFGIGLVETVEDFGVQGALPSHPELLDWLAVGLRDRQWETRSVLREIVLSATYRQASRVSPEMLERDPRNRLLARGPRHRLSAEMLRDSALAISGLLTEHVGGPSVKPYQPEGLWEDVSVERREKYQPETGAGLYRRSLYTFWKRTCPPPTMTTFDAPDRETCVVRRARTNTPLQALVLLNDPTYVEAARNLAERAMLAETSDGSRLRWVFKRAVARLPDAREVQALQTVLDASKVRFHGDPNAAERLTSFGASRRNAQLDVRDLAAWTSVANVVLNLDEAVSKY